MLDRLSLGSDIEIARLILPSLDPDICCNYAGDWRRFDKSQVKGLNKSKWKRAAITWHANVSRGEGFDDRGPRGNFDGDGLRRDMDRTDKLNFFVIAIGESAGLKSTRTRYNPHLLWADERICTLGYSVSTRSPLEIAVLIGTQSLQRGQEGKEERKSEEKGTPCCIQHMRTSEESQMYVWPAKPHVLTSNCSVYMSIKFFYISCTVRVISWDKSVEISFVRSY